MECVIGIITKDSYNKMQEAPVSFIDVLNSTLKIPCDCYILVDDSSSSDTLEKFMEWCRFNNKKFIIRSGAGNRARARQMVIDLFMRYTNSEWLLFVDDDVIIRDGWWDEAEKYLDNPKIGLLWGINWDGYPQRPLWLRALGIDYKTYLIKEFYRRGGTHDTLLRREAIDGIHIPSELHFFEDWYILEYVRNRGYDVQVLEIGVMHYNPWDEKLSNRDIQFMAQLSIKHNIDTGSIVYRMFRLFKSVIGLPLGIVIGVKAFGSIDGFKRAFRRWRIKVLYRVFVLMGERIKLPEGVPHFESPQTSKIN